MTIAVMGLAVCAAFATPAAAQDHVYSAEQIQAGYRLYTAQCQLCHGPNGDGIAGINLARQQFHTVVSDDDIRKMVTTGNPQGMPPFTFKPDELDELVAFVRSGLDHGGISFQLGDAARGKAVVKFFDWAFTNGGKIAEDLQYIPLPTAVQASVRSDWAKLP